MSPINRVCFFMWTGTYSMLTGLKSVNIFFVNEFIRSCNNVIIFKSTGMFKSSMDFPIAGMVKSWTWSIYLGKNESVCINWLVSVNRTNHKQRQFKFNSNEIFHWVQNLHVNLRSHPPDVLVDIFHSSSNSKDNNSSMLSDHNI